MCDVPDCGKQAIARVELEGVLKTIIGDVQGDELAPMIARDLVREGGTRVCPHHLVKFMGLVLLAVKVLGNHPELDELATTYELPKNVRVVTMGEEFELAEEPAYILTPRIEPPEGGPWN